MRVVAEGHEIYEYTALAAALSGAVEAAGSTDRIVVFGSFYTVSTALEPGNDAWWRSAGTVRNEHLSVG